MRKTVIPISNEKSKKESWHLAWQIASRWERIQWEKNEFCCPTLSCFLSREREVENREGKKRKQKGEDKLVSVCLIHMI